MCDIINVKKSHIYLINQKFSDDRPSLVPLPPCSFKPIKHGIESIERDVSRSSVNSNKCARLISENEETCYITTTQQNAYHQVKGKHI